MNSLVKESSQEKYPPEYKSIPLGIIKSFVVNKLGEYGKIWESGNGCNVHGNMFTKLSYTSDENDNSEKKKHN